jgi:multidrug resistance efflux pump
LDFWFWRTTRPRSGLFFPVVDQDSFRVEEYLEETNLNLVGVGDLAIVTPLSGAAPIKGEVDGIARPQESSRGNSRVILDRSYGEIPRDADRFRNRVEKKADQATGL